MFPGDCGVERMSKGRMNGWLLTVFLSLIIHSNGFQCPTCFTRNSFCTENLSRGADALHMSASSGEENFTNLSAFLKKGVRSAVGLVISCSMLVSFHAPAYAEEWTDKNRLAAEAWRAVDEIYYDRTFSGNDWFKLRQEIVKKDYKTDEEVYKSIASMLLKLGDKYTRFLAPAQYTALMNSAQGELTGVGLELQVHHFLPFSYPLSSSLTLQLPFSNSTYYCKHLPSFLSLYSTSLS